MKGVLRSYTGIVQAGRDGVCFENLSVLILKQVAHLPVQYAGPSFFKGAAVFVRINTQAASFDSYALDLFIFEEVLEYPDGIGASADTCDDMVRQPSLFFKYLTSGLIAYDRLKITYHHRVGVWTGNSAYDIIGVTGVGYPVAYGIVHCVFESFRAAFNCMHFCSKQFHAKYIQLLACNVFGSHKYVTLQA